MPESHSIEVKFKTEGVRIGESPYLFGWDCVRCGRHFGQVKSIMGHWCEEGLRAELQKRLREAVEEDLMHAILYGLRR